MRWFMCGCCGGKFASLEKTACPCGAGEAGVTEVTADTETKPTPLGALMETFFSRPFEHAN